MVSGLLLTVLGMGGVFLFLFVLYGILKIAERFLIGSPAGSSALTSAVTNIPDSSDQPISPEISTVIAAAVSHHRKGHD